MAGYIEAAQVAQQGFRDLSKGLSNYGESKVKRSQAEELRGMIPGSEGKVLAGDVLRGETASKVLGSRAERQFTSPTQVFGKYLELAFDPNADKETRMQAREVVGQLMPLMQMMSGGGGKGGGEGGDDVSTDKLLSRWIEIGRKEMEKDPSKRDLKALESVKYVLTTVGAKSGLNKDGISMGGNESKNTLEAIDNAITDLKKNQKGGVETPEPMIGGGNDFESITGGSLRNE